MRRSDVASLDDGMRAEGHDEAELAARYCSDDKRSSVSALWHFADIEPVSIADGQAFRCLTENLGQSAIGTAAARTAVDYISKNLTDRDLGRGKMEVARNWRP
jgi:hypothetical protein